MFDKVLTSSSVNGMNFGVDGTTCSDAPFPSSSSLNTAMELFDPDATLFFTTAGTGGGILELAPPPFSSSTNTAIFGTPLPDAVRFAFPAWRSVVPAALLTSGTFSFTRVLRVPSSAQGDAAAASGLSAPEGSTKICMRPFGRGAVAAEEEPKTSLPEEEG